MKEDAPAQPKARDSWDPTGAPITGCLCACMLSHVGATFATLWTVALKASLSMGFSRQEYWSELPFRPPEDLPNPGIEPASPVSQQMQVGAIFAGSLVQGCASKKCETYL